MAPKKHRSVRHRKRCSKAYKLLKIKGGDASNYAASVYGGIGQQHAIADNNHVIAMNNVPCGQSGGSDPLMAVTTMSPSVLLKGGNGAVAPVQATVPVNIPVPAAMSMPAAMPMPAAMSMPAAMPAAMRGGRNDQDEEESDSLQKGGESILADLAVPAVLLIANQAMTKRYRKSGKKSRKYKNKGSYKRRR